MPNRIIRELDFDLVQAIHGRVITLGDVVAHNVSLNSFDQVCATFTKLLGTDLVPLIKDAISRETSIADLVNPSGRRRPEKPIITSVDEMRKSLSRLYDVRHILCHEVPSRTVYEREEIDGFLIAAAEFAGATHAALTLLLYSDASVTLSEMIHAKAAQLNELDVEVSGLLEKLS